MTSQLSSRLASPAAAPIETSRQSSANSTSMQQVPKLRDSCVACASSKVRCHRQKPSCSRCLKRKITCEYVTSKRGGRNPAGRSETTATGTATATATAANTGNKKPTAKASKSSTSARQSSRPPTPPLEWFGPSFHHRDAVQLPRRTTAASTMSPTALIDPFLTSDASATMEMEGLDSGFDCYLASPPTYYSSLDYEREINSANSCMVSNLEDLGDFDMVMDSEYTLPLTDPSLTSEGSITPALLSSLSSTSLSSASNPILPTAFLDNILTETQDYEHTNLQCGCLIYAVGLMKQLFAEQQSGVDFPCQGAAARRSNMTAASSRVHTTIARNKHAIDLVESILQCCCPHDSYLLLILSMVLLKVLDSYADAAHHRRSSTTSSSSSLSPPMSGNVSPVGRNSSIGSNLGSIEDVCIARYSTSRSTSSSQSPTGCTEKGRRSYHGPSNESHHSIRASMQLILGELHRPQRLVNQLSELLKKEAARNNGRSLASLSNCSSPNMLYSSLGGGHEDASLFSDVIWRQLGQDLRRRLQKLSLDILEALKRE